MRRRGGDNRQRGLLDEAALLQSEQLVLLERYRHELLLVAGMVFSYVLRQVAFVAKAL